MELSEELKKYMLVNNLHVDKLSTSDRKLEQLFFKVLGNDFDKEIVKEVIRWSELIAINNSRVYALRDKDREKGDINEIAFDNQQYWDQVAEVMGRENFKRVYLIYPEEMSR